MYNETNKVWKNEYDLDFIINFVGSYHGANFLPNDIKYPFVYTWLDLSKNARFRINFNIQTMTIYCHHAIKSFVIEEDIYVEDMIIDAIYDFIIFHTKEFNKTLEVINNISLLDKGWPWPKFSAVLNQSYSFLLTLCKYPV